MSPTKAAHRRAEALRSKKSDSTRKPSANSPPPAYQRRSELRGSDDQYLAARSTDASDGNGDSFGEFSHNAAELQAQSTQPLSDINSIAAVYGALDAEQTAFLRERPHLVPILLTARPLIAEVFGNSALVSLDLIEPDQPSAHLYLLIHTKLSYRDSAALDKAFEEKWIAAVPHTIHSELTPTLQFD